MSPSESAAAPEPVDAPTGSSASARSVRAAPSERRSVQMTADRILVAVPDDAERRTKAGLVIPATAQSVDRRGVWGEVIAVGPNVRGVDPGAEVLYLPSDAIEVEVQDDAYLIVRERDVHAIASSSRGGTTGLYL